MLNSIEAAVSTLEDAGAVVYEISQPGSFKQKAEAPDTQTLIDKFLGDWDKLVPGIYKVDYSKSSQDKRSGLCFRISKVQPAQGSPAQLAGFDTDRIGALQQQISNLETERRIDTMQQQHKEEIRALLAKQDKENGGLTALDGPSLLAGLDKIQNIMSMATGARSLPVPAPVAQLGAAPLIPAEPGLNPSEAALTVALESLETVLGGEVLIQTLAKLAHKGQENPEALRKALGYIDLL
jgi:hypothetical protein